MTLAAARELLERIVTVATATLDPPARCNVPSATWLALRREVRDPSKTQWRVIDDAADALTIACHNLSLSREDGDADEILFWTTVARALLPRCVADLTRERMAQ